MDQRAERSDSALVTSHLREAASIALQLAKEVKAIGLENQNGQLLSAFIPNLLRARQDSLARVPPVSVSPFLLWLPRSKTTTLS